MIFIEWAVFLFVVGLIIFLSYWIYYLLEKSRKRAIWVAVLTKRSAEGDEFAQELLTKYGDKLK